jgi:hypothetical protein
MEKESNKFYKYEITLGGFRIENANSEKEVWDVLGKRPFGEIYTVFDLEKDEFPPEFIPF